ncbi:DUF4132 domain-containing protein [Glycomyces sp. NPDC046736]|uniref:DUF4132 domain-containing protein n=1 Tax=Glycomyces sp. NPDC046736 TaxID=3155615 RepID=UPI0033F4AB7F
MNLTDTPERLELPESWRTHLLDRRGSGTPKPVTIDPEAPQRLRGLMEKWADAYAPAAALIESSDHQDAVVGWAEGKPDPLGAALTFAILKQVMPRNMEFDDLTARDAWITEHGLEFAVQAFLELLSHNVYWRSKSQRFEARLTIREVTGSWVPHLAYLLKTAAPMRSLLAGLPEAEYLRVRDALALRRSSDGYKFLSAMFMPDQEDWVRESCAIQRTHWRHEAGSDPFWAVARTREHLELADVKRMDLNGDPASRVPLVVDALGTDAFPILVGTIEGESRPPADTRDRLYEALSLLPTDEAVGYLLRDLADPHSMIAARAAAKRFPARTLRVLAQTAASAPAHAKARLAGFAKANGLLELDATETAVVEELLASTRHHPEADELPAAFTTPPWTGFAKPVAGPTGLTPPVIDELRWAPGEQDEWRELPDGYWYSRDAAWDRVMPGDPNPKHYAFPEFLAYADESRARPALALWDGSVSPYVHHPATIGALLARFGDEAAARVLALIKKKPSLRVYTLPFVNLDVARMAADWVARSRVDRATGQAWLQRHATDAVALLVPDAVGKPGRPRQVAEAALRHLAIKHRELVREGAASYGEAALAAVDAVLDADPLDPRVPRVPKPPAWADPAMLPQVLLKGRTAALPDAAVRLLLTALALDDSERPYAGVDVLAAECDPDSLTAFSWGLFELWTSSGSPTKDGWAFDQLRRFADDDTVRRLTALIREWPGRSQSRKSVRGLEILGRIGTEDALRAVQSIAGNAKFKSLKKTAAAQIEIIAERLELTLDELADRLVPDFGLGAEAAMVLDYGPRSFTIKFDESLKPYLLDEKGKRRASAPKPAAKDDPELAQRSYERFAALRKDVKATSAEQVKRFEAAMTARRAWGAADFQRFVVDHPLVWQLSSRLVWETTVDGQARSFRLAEDRTLADAEDDPFELPEGAEIRLAHPITLGSEAVEAWSTVFADYEILQPFDQLARPAFTLSEQDRIAGRLHRFEAEKVSGGAIVGLMKRGWQYGQPKGHKGTHAVYLELPGESFLIVDTVPGVYPGYGDQGDHRVEITFRGSESIDPVTLSEALYTVARLTHTV